MSGLRLARMAPDGVPARGLARIDADTRARARAIVDEVERGGEPELRRLAEELDGLAPGASLVLGPDALAAAAARIDADDLALLERVAGRVAAFARLQRDALGTVDAPVPGGRAGHDVAPVAAAGCYAPGGRYPLPSSVLMTAVTARAAGVERVVVASPAPSDIVLAAAHAAGADAVLCAGGAQAVAALAHGVPGVLEPVDVIVGPGNRWVTAAKEAVFGVVGVDLPAGPSELVLVLDGSADPDVAAADLIAQAEHDPDARAGLVAIGPGLVEAVEEALERRLSGLATAAVAREALERNGFACEVDSWRDARDTVARLAPEHLQLSIEDAEARRAEVDHYGGVFVGEASAEVLGDYGAGPNHVLPTAGAARFSGGLSVLAFLRVRTWLRMDDPGAIAGDCARLARLEGLEGHARAAELRSPQPVDRSTAVDSAAPPGAAGAAGAPARPAARTSSTP